MRFVGPLTSGIAGRHCIFKPLLFPYGRSRGVKQNYSKVAVYHTIIYSLKIVAIFFVPTGMLCGIPVDVST